MNEATPPIRSCLEPFRDHRVHAAGPARTLIEVRGRDRATFLHNFCTNDIRKLPPGLGCEVLFTNVKARVLAHGWIFAAEDHHWIDTVAGQAQQLLTHLERYVITEDVELIDRTDDFRVVYAAGPPDATDDEWRTSIAVDEPGQLRLRLDWNWPVEVLRVASGSADGPEDSGQVTPSDWETFRIERGIPVWGRDVSEDLIAQEVDRIRQCISFTKGCYLGQEPIARLDAMGHVNRAIRCVRFDDSVAEITAPADVFLADSGDGQPPAAGTLTSIGSDSTGRSVVGLGLLKRAAMEPGTRVRIVAASTAVDGTVFWTPGQSGIVTPGSC